MADLLELSGLFAWERRSPSGLLLASGVAKNRIVDAALNDVLEVYFRSETQKPNWFIGLIDDAGFSALSSSDTMASHPGWIEATAYSETTRRSFVPGLASGGRIIASSRAVFTASATVTVVGIFVVSNNTKGGTAGTLWSTVLLNSKQTLYLNEKLSIGYALTATNG